MPQNNIEVNNLKKHSCKSSLPYLNGFLENLIVLQLIGTSDGLTSGRVIVKL